MYISKRKNGIYYVFYFQDNGKKTCISTKTKLKTEALKFLTRFQSECEQRKKQSIVQISFKEYFEGYVSYSRNIHTALTHKGYKLSLSNLKNFLGDILLNEVTSIKMSQYFEQKVQASSIYQARKDLIVFNSFFNKAVAEGCMNSNPCKGIKKFKIPQRLPLFFSQVEFDKLLNEINEQDLHDIVLFAVQTGLRQMELITLTWRQIDLAEASLILDNLQHLTKSQKVRTIPLTSVAVEILKKRELDRNKNIHPDYAFTYNSRAIIPSTLTHKFKFYVRKAEINPKLKFHSLRHTFASWLVQRGVSIYAVSKLLGHSSISVTEIYSHLRAEDLRSAISKLN